MLDFSNLQFAEVPDAVRPGVTNIVATVVLTGSCPVADCELDRARMHAQSEVRGLLSRQVYGEARQAAINARRIATDAAHSAHSCLEVERAFDKLLQFLSPNQQPKKENTHES
jgi:hypothetical protein